MAMGEADDRDPDLRGFREAAITFGVVGTVVLVMRLPYQTGDVLIAGAAAIAAACIAGAYTWKQGEPGDEGWAAGTAAVAASGAFVLWLVTLIATEDQGRSVHDLVDLTNWAVASVFAAIALLWLIAREWSRLSYHVLLVVVLLLLGTTTVLVGRATQADSLARQTRSTATSLSQQVERAQTSAMAKANAAAAAKDAAIRDAVTAASESRRVAIEALEEAIGADALDAETGCAADAAQLPAPRAMCAAVVPLAKVLSQDPTNADVRRQDRRSLDEARTRLVDLRDTGLARADLPRVRRFLRAIDAAAAIPEPAAPASTAQIDLARARLGRLCEAAGGTPTGPVGSIACTRAAGASTGGSDISARQIELRRRLVELSLAELQGDGAAVDAARSAAATAAAERGDPDPGVPVQDLLVDGATEMLGALPLIGSSSFPADAGPLGAALLVIAALLGLRALEALNGDHGPVTVSFGEFEAKGDAKDLQALFKRSVLINVPEPSAVPGGSSASGLTDLLEATDPTGKVVSAILKAARVVTAITTGTTVDAAYRTSGTGAAQRHEVFVRVRAARTKKLLATYVVSEPSADIAVRNAGYWVAATVLREERTRPSWTAWTDSSSGPLAVHDAAAEVDVDRLAWLEHALQAAPTSGLVLMRLSNEYDLRGRYVDSLEMSLRAAICHPRYPEAVYRLVASLGNLADDPASTWLGAEPTQRARICASLHRWPENTVELPQDPAAAPDATAALRSFVARSGQAFARASNDAHLRAVRRLRLLDVLVFSLRRSEREFWLHLVTRRSGRELRRRVRATLTAGNSIGLTHLERWSAEVEDRLPTPIPEPSERDLDAWWQVAYNLACFQAVRRDGNRTAHQIRAMELLEHTRELPGSGDLTRGWATADPDLRALHTQPRFQAFVARLAD